MFLIKSSACSKELSILQERMGIHYDFSIDQHYPPLYNDQDLFENIQKEIPFTNLEAPVLIAEDFAFYGKYAPSFSVLLEAAWRKRSTAIRLILMKVY